MIKCKISVLKEYYTPQRRVERNFRADHQPTNNISKSVNFKMKQFTKITRVISYNQAVVLLIDF
jgi:hypothetical protein